MIEFMTCGESHGKQLSAILEGMPSGIRMDPDLINHDLWRRQQGFGRGGRQKIESDKIEITGGIYRGRTTGAPIGLSIHNKDAKIDELPQLWRPRPGHADLAGVLKYNVGIREILERASARETAMRVAVGSIAKLFLLDFGIKVAAHVVQIGKARIKAEVSFDAILKRSDDSQVNCVSPDVEKAMIREIKKAMKDENTVGGKFEVCVRGVPIGLGSHVHYKRKLDGRIAQGLMSLQTVKAVEFGIGVLAAEVFGSEAHDEIYFDPKRSYYHTTNRAGGITGGMSNGSEIRVRAIMKPISTLGKPLRSVNMKTKAPEKADFERSDICAVPAGSVVGESIVAFEIADAFLEKFGGDSVAEIKRNYKGYLRSIEV